MLKVQSVHKTFFPGTVNEVKALNNVSLEIKESSFTAIIGTNGSGKSTLLNAVAGSFLVDKGRIELANNNISKWPEYKRAIHIGRVFQNPFAGTATEMSIAENIVMSMRRGKSRGFKRALSKRNREEMAERIRELNMGLEDRLDNPIGTLSGGQRQALTLFMATWNRPDLLLLDEHTAALDPKSAAKVAELTSRIIEREKLTALMVTHSMQQAVDMPDRIIMMHKGQIMHDYDDEEKQRVRIPDLMGRFEQIAKSELLDESASEMIIEQYG